MLHELSGFKIVPAVWRKCLQLANKMQSQGPGAVYRWWAYSLCRCYVSSPSVPHLLHRPCLKKKKGQIRITMSISLLNIFYVVSSIKLLVSVIFWIFFPKAPATVFYCHDWIKNPMNKKITTLPPLSTTKLRNKVTFFNLMRLDKYFRHMAGQLYWGTLDYHHRILFEYLL